jgi:hypothetical protein
MKYSFELIKKLINKKKILFHNMEIYDVKRFILFINSTFILFLFIWSCILCIVSTRLVSWLFNFQIKKIIKFFY